MDEITAEANVAIENIEDEKGIKRTINSEDESEIDDANPQITKGHELQTEEEEESIDNLKIIKTKKVNKNKAKKNKASTSLNSDPTKLEENASQVQERFKRGCECQDEQCFQGLDPEAVYKHRLNIAELTKSEHDMYLMGVIRSCLGNPYETNKHTERQRLRAQYVYQGRQICLDAFLYLENCTHYQVKRIRKHLSIHGVTPRVHGNCGKVPHNTFSLNIYQIATKFVKEFIKKQELKQKSNTPKNSPLYLPADITRKTVHDLYKEYCSKSSPDIKIMGYSTFRTFLKVQFPQLRFAKLEFVVRKTEIDKAATTNATIQAPQILNENGDLVPVIIASEPNSKTQTFILTPPTKLQEGVNYQISKSRILIAKSSQPVTITNINAF